MHVGLANKFAELWESGEAAPDVFAYLQQHPNASPSERLDILLSDQQKRWQTDTPLRVEDYLAQLSGLTGDPGLKMQLAVGEFQARQSGETTPDIAEFTSRFSDLGDSLRSKLSELISNNQQAGQDPFRTNAFDPASEVGRALPPPEACTYQRIGRYRLTRLLGQGGFGRVWLGVDEELQRQVAIKVPTPQRFQCPEDAETYLAEARTVAGLDHPHIVPVYDVGRSDDGSVYVVSKFIEGSDLAERIRRDRPACDVAATWLAIIANALHHAHQKRLIHRDVKPANILIEGKTGTPYVTDFGLAISEEDYLRDSRIAGTPAYMSPEQARGEGHRLDHRSDVFSVGVVLYELLTGERPFRGSSVDELLQQVISFDPSPVRDCDDSIPAELERICQKAMSKRASDRYASAAELADDLRQWQLGPKLSQAECQIVPKGLRSFDADDADFFLQLLPGPRNRDGLPECIQFWKSRLEQQDADRTFSVGLIYGPSGCGKSSLVKAGLLPRLSKEVTAFYIEATPDETELRILRGLRKQLRELSPDLGLVETFAALRRREGRKVVVIVDQFEQWLHARRTEQSTDLVNALRQCDGAHVQAVVMVRDDFAMAATRFMDALDIPIVQGQNFSTVDLFDVEHAQKVLIKFGQAFGKLPDQVSGFSDDERQFLSAVAAGLAQDGKVVSVRLALFAEMIKGKSWIPATLEQVGGTAGIGLNFLDETFSSRIANPQHRRHQQAARAVLKSLLPEVGADIKGHMRSYAELLHASGYDHHPADFHDLLRILDGELRLITPTDPAGVQSNSDPDSKYYQLTHDYMVHSLREWLTRMQQETRRGRAELRLGERSALWKAKRENQQLPSLWEFLSIRLWTDSNAWTNPQRKMMRKAGRVQGRRLAVAATVIVIASFAALTIRSSVLEKQDATRAHGLVQSVLNAETAQVPSIVAEMAGYRKWSDPLLRQKHDQAAMDSREKLHASLALLPVDRSQVNYLCDRLLQAEPHEVPVIRDALALHGKDLRNKLWAVVESPSKGTESQRLRAAAALATYDPNGLKWAKVQEDVANDLVRVPAVYLAAWMESLRPVRTTLFPQLSAVFRDTARREVERSLATDILAEYAADNPDVLADLLLDADQKQFAVIYSKFKEHGEQGLSVLTGELEQILPPDAIDNAKEGLAKRQVNAAVALLRMNQPEKVWPLLTHRSDPRVRSYLIHWLGPLGADTTVIVKHLEQESDVAIRRALLLTLGPEEFGEEAWTPGQKALLVERLQEIYRDDDDPGLHSAAEWLLRQWKQEAWLQQVDDASRQDQQQWLNHVEGTSPQWYANSQGRMMVVIPGPVEFVMGSSLNEQGRNENESPHKKRISRTFAIAAKPVTLAEYRVFDAKFSYGGLGLFAPTADCPVIGTTWYEAAAYCNWLSQQDGLSGDEWCYETNSEGVVTKLKENYLSLLGYRLPTEAEWEYACRAGASTSRCYGESDELLGKYSWYLQNSTNRSWPSAAKKPNDLGLFDMHGNVNAWCQESYQEHYSAATSSAPSEDREDHPTIVPTAGRVLRGGSYGDSAVLLRAANRFRNVPSDRVSDVGFRPARTLRGAKNSLSR